ncbi:glycosyltransferase family 2 protein [Cognatiyoonia sp. IB215182]|uniref:glycosyltransferase family 2 protein n=1 Tax=Cognatiyoonia sp. IB215182 TaxID=3097353 RepID=UPI002A0C90CF|nr:glycosyltransferase family 2 protein [Cognatiyoonia sp. IB215182]MDX8353652.1 glycosyltransferase family 2 protein [Cognatiyoonia sp. IB215182]
MPGTLIERRLAGREIAQVRIIDVVEHAFEGQRYVTLFCDAGSDPDSIEPVNATRTDVRSVVGAPVLTFAMEGADRPRFLIDGEEATLTPAEAELPLFEGRNAIVAERNGEDATTVLEWLHYHMDRHDLEGVVLLDRAKPGADPDFVSDLTAVLPDLPVVLVSSDLPLGKPGFPPEAHPFCVPEAPGKDRMKVPAPDPWQAPLGVLTWYEITRMRFLAEARAVANIDVHDLITASETSAFDRAVGAKGGLITLSGRHCYPWRTRPNQPTRFADHICVQFDARGGRMRWCLAPAKAPDAAVWRMVRVGNAVPDRTQRTGFYRHMALRHSTESISKIVPKTSLIEDDVLLAQAKDYFKHDPVRVPEVAPLEVQNDRRAIVTTMKNEGPFILEWLAYHRAIGFDDFLVYTNDCSDGTDTMLQMLMQKGLVQHRENPYRQMDLKPQHAALQAAEDEPLIRDAKWVACIDVDEFVNVKVGDGTLQALFDAVPDANMIAMTWRLFGNADRHAYADRPVTEQFTRCAPELARKPHQAWGFKTLFENNGIFKKLGVHRPKGLNPQLWEMINWVNGSGRSLPRGMYRNGWRSTTETYGYDLVQLNHYAVRSAESFLVKRDRGRVNHVDRDQGLAYWFRMNNNAEEDHSIQKRLPMMQAELARRMADPDIAAAHHEAVAWHRERITALKGRPDYAKLYETLTAERLEALSRLHSHFGANVFLSGPDVIPDEVLARNPEEDWFFTVELAGETAH